jgi:hypothetical protein
VQAILVSSPLGCGTVRGRIERLRLGNAAPILDSVQRRVVAKIIDGFNPPTQRSGGGSRKRIRLRPGRRLQAVRLGQRRRLPGQNEVPDRLRQRLAHLTRTFSTATAFHAWLQLRTTSTPMIANRYFLFHA